MTDNNRRIHNRASIRLPVLPISSQPEPIAGSEVWTSNISAGGMYFRAPAAQAIETDTELSFELQVPPGSGYSVSGGTIKGSGRVIRTDLLDENAQGVAMSFTEPLALSF